MVNVRESWQACVEGAAEALEKKLYEQVGSLGHVNVNARRVLLAHMTDSITSPLRAVIVLTLCICGFSSTGPTDKLLISQAAAFVHRYLSLDKHLFASEDFQDSGVVLAWGLL